MTRSTAPTTSRSPFLRDFDALSGFGATSRGGVHREAATEADREARDWLAGRFAEIGLEARVDSVGNLFGCADWVPGAPYVLVGSHLDSQPTAGRLDGAYGVLSALHAADRVRDEVAAGSLQPTLNLAVVDWFNEEGSRFWPSVMGSGVYAGILNAASVLDTRDADGISVREALEMIGYLGRNEAPRAAAYAEIHIEQGRELEEAEVPIGIVTGNWSTAKLLVRVHGEQAHTASLMADRHDALLAAGALVMAVNDLVDAAPAGELLTTVSRLDTYPNVPGVVTSHATLHVDLRSADAEVLNAALDALRTGADALGERFGVRATLEGLSVRPALPYPPEGVALAEEVATRCGLASRRLLTRAGHDSIAMRAVAPTVMLFVPSRDGLSHHEREDTLEDDLESGVDMLSAVVARLVAGDLTMPAEETRS